MTKCKGPFRTHLASTRGALRKHNFFPILSPLTKACAGPLSNVSGLDTARPQHCIILDAPLLPKGQTLKLAQDVSLGAILNEINDYPQLYKTSLTAD